MNVSISNKNRKTRRFHYIFFTRRDFPYLTDTEVEEYTLADMELRKPDRNMRRAVPAFGGITLREVSLICSRLLQLNNQRQREHARVTD